MSEQPLDLKRSLAVARRHRRALAAFALAGLAGGAAYAFVRPPTPTASALVLLPPAPPSSTTNNASQDTKTDIVIASSLPVLEQAARETKPQISPDTLKHHVSVSSLSDDVLRFEAKMPNGPSAVDAANAVAQSYISYTTSASAASSSTALSSLRSQASSLTGQIQQLQSQIQAVSSRLAAEGPASSAGQSDTSLLGSLRSEEGQISLSLDSVNSQIANLQVSGGLQSGSTRLLQSAVLAGSPSTAKKAAEYGVIGAAGGLLVGFIFVLVRWGDDPRLRLRDDIARVIGAPVVGSLGSKPRASTSDWLKLLRGTAAPAAETWVLRRVLRRLMPEGHDRGLTMTVLSFSRDQAALTVGPRLAVFASRHGVATAMLVSDQPALGSLRAACAAMEGSEAEPALRFVFDEEPEVGGMKLLVRVVQVDRSKPTLGGPSDVLVVAVSPGQATVEEVARLALAASERKVEISGIVVVNPDPDDSTLGASVDGPPISVRRPATTVGSASVGGQR